jgi:hypothetical protein
MKRQWLGWKYALMIIGLAVLALLVMDFNNRMAELKRLSSQSELVAAEVTSLVQTQTHLQTQIAYATSEAAVMEWAYQEGHWLREGDVPVVPLAEGSAPEPTAMPIPTQTPESNWQIWFSLFFDRQPPSNFISP